MITKTYILQNLQQINTRFRNARTAKDPFYFSKIAILELCGWIELSQDDILHRIAAKRLSDPQNTKYLMKKIVKVNYGFGYEDHFRRMLIQAVGLIAVEKIEARVDAQKKADLVSELNTLVKMRNNLAHTYIKGTAVTVDAPSVTIARFVKIYDGFKEYEDKIFKTI